jgi:hypothetical protein
MYKIIIMKIKILEDKWCGMRKLVKNREIQLSSQSWYIYYIY